MENEARVYFDEQMEQLKEINRKIRKANGIEIVGLSWQARALREELQDYKYCDLSNRKLVI